MADWNEDLEAMESFVLEGKRFVRLPEEEVREHNVNVGCTVQYCDCGVCCLFWFLFSARGLWGFYNIVQVIGCALLTIVTGRLVLQP